MKTISSILKTLALWILRFSRKFNPPYEYLLISTDEIIYSDSEYIATIALLAQQKELHGILYKKMCADGYEEFVENISALEKNIITTDKRLVKASEVYNGAENTVGRLQS